MAEDPVEAYRLLIADVYELAGRSRRTSESFARAHGQTAARWHVMSVLTDGRHTVPEVADRLGLTRQSVQRVIDELAADGLVRLVENPRHRRSRQAELTATGRRTVDRLFETSSQVRSEQVAAAGVTAAELDQAREVLRRLVETIDELDRP